MRFTHPFAISDRELTWGQFSPFDSDKLRQEEIVKCGRALDAQDPAFYVSWFDAVRYCRWLTERLGMNESDQCYRAEESPEKDRDGFPKVPLAVDRKGFRLPTESEWEVACRAGTATAYSFGSDRDLVRHYGCFQENAPGWSVVAGELRPNLLGLFDMHGNLFEWCHDKFGPRPVGPSVVLVDFTGPEVGAGWCSRGGGWSNTRERLRSAFRNGDRRTDRNQYLGFRLVVAPQAFGEAQPVP